MRLPDGCHPKWRGLCACGCNPALTKYFPNVTRNKLADFLVVRFLFAFCFYPYFSVCFFISFFVSSFFLVILSPFVSASLSRPRLFGVFIPHRCCSSQHHWVGLANMRQKWPAEVSTYAAAVTLPYDHPLRNFATLESLCSFPQTHVSKERRRWLERNTSSQQKTRLGLRFLIDYLSRLNTALVEET